MRAINPVSGTVRADIRAFLLYGIGVAGLGFIAYELATASIDWQSFREVSLSSLLLVVGARAAGSLLFAVQCKVLQDRLAAVSFPTACRVIVSTYYLNYFPFRGPQLMTRAMIARRHGVPYLSSVASLAVNLLARWVIIGVTLLLLGYRLAGNESYGVLWPVSAVAVFAPVALLLALRSSRRVLAALSGRLGRMAGPAVRVRNGAQLSDELSRNIARVFHWRGLLPYAAALAAAVLLEHWALAALWSDLGAPIFFVDLMLVFLAGGMAGWFSQLPGGFGVHEVVSAYLVSLTGLDFSLAVAVILLSRVLVLLVDLSVSSASFLLLRGGPSVPADPA